MVCLRKLTLYQIPAIGADALSIFHNFWLFLIFLIV